MKRLLMTLILVTIAAMLVPAQTYNSNTGGYNTGYGTVYGTFGLAQATQNMYNTMQMNMQRSIMRQAMIKKWGLAAVEKAEREVSGSKRSSTTTPSAGPAVEPRPAPKNFGKFRPDPTVDTAKMFADTLGETPEEKALYKQIVLQTKAAFEKEAAAKGWQNNIAGAFTFFIISTSTIYHDAPEPADTAVAALYDAVDLTLDEIPEFGKLSNRDKQALYNTLIGFGGIPLATYAEGKGNGSEETVALARAIAGKMIELVLKADPQKVRFTDAGLSLER